MVEMREFARNSKSIPAQKLTCKQKMENSQATNSTLKKLHLYILLYIYRYYAHSKKLCRRLRYFS